MSDQRPRVIFNSYARPAEPVGGALLLYGDDPVIELTYLDGRLRTAPQLAQIEQLAGGLPADAAVDGLFGAEALRWAYQIFGWSNPGAAASGSADPPPVAPVTAEERERQLAAASEDTAGRRILFFNVIVALEWAPDADYMLQLRWAFRRASDFLYDATDGLMAFGQVVLGGPELMGCADVQIMASNRLHPRSWVGGLLEPAKYQPIRVGRGIWHERNRVLLPWDEPEGYRTLIHEWCHYALNLMDGYLESRPSARPGVAVVVPKIEVSSTSIMDSLEGTSELFSQRGVRGSEVREDAWAVIARAYPDLLPKGSTLPSGRNGPARLPLPLPAFRVADSLATPAPAALIPPLARDGEPSELAVLLTQHLVGALPLAEELYEVVRVNMRRVLAGRCWVMLLCRDEGTFTHVIAQGTLDARAAEDGFPIYGAHPGDLLHLTFEDPTGRTLVYKAELLEREDQLVPASWEGLSPQLPLVDVIPQLREGDGAAELWIDVTVEGADGGLPIAGLVVEQGAKANGKGHALRERSRAAGASLKLQRLDGHVLLEWPDRGLTVSSFSHGGGPPTHGGISPVSFSAGFAPAGVPNTAVRTLRQATSVKSPITAGSTDGRVMVFFEPYLLETEAARATAQQRYYEAVRVVTTAVRGVGLPAPAPQHTPASSLYTLATTMPIPAGLDPTLVIYLDTIEAPPGQMATIYVWERGEWQAQRTEQARGGRRFVFMSLRDTPLVAAVTDYSLRADPRKLSFRVYWAP